MAVTVVKDPLLPLQTAVFALLNGDSVLTALAPVFDEVPQNQPYPYIVIGEMIESEWRTNTSPGAEVGFIIHAWTSNNADRGNRKVLLIKNELDRLLGDIITLTITDFTLNFIMVESTNIIKEQIEGGIVLRHLIRRYRAKLQQD